MAGHRVEEGHLTVTFDDVEWVMVVIGGAKDTTALRKLHELLEKISAGELPDGE